MCGDEKSQKEKNKEYQYFTQLLLQLQELICRE
jgi:hypothetical protein